MNYDLILNGIHIGEHSFDPDRVIDEIYERCVKPGLNFVTIRTNKNQVPQEYFLKWASYLAEHQIYFIFLYTIQQSPVGTDSQFTPETVARMKEIAGEYFIGDMIGETGSSGACKFIGYYGDLTNSTDSASLLTRHPDMEAAHKGYLDYVTGLVKIDHDLGMPDVVSVEATGLNKYNAEAGVTIPMLELMCGNPDILVSSLRGTARAIDSKLWGTYVAHEWYGGMRHDDTLKRKRLELAYKYAYLAGTHALCLESGDELIASYGHRFEPDSPICEDYQRVLTSTMDYIRQDKRPAGGPRVKFAFVSGLHDAWGGWGGSSVWNQFCREEWGHREAEHSWRLLDEIGIKRSWTDIANYGDHDLSASPAYGMYDIVPIEADLEKLLRYDYLIFLGWNSMTEENLLKLTEYVEQGGHLLMTAAHLSTGTVRGGAFECPSNEMLEKLFGVRYTGKIHRTLSGVKFSYDSLDDNLLYPGTKSFACDPIYSSGYLDYAEFDLCGGHKTAYVSDSFLAEPEGRPEGQPNMQHMLRASGLPAVIEHRLGTGTATLVTSTNYPGYPPLMPLYRALLREMVTASARCCPIRVLGSDRLRYAVYEGNVMYLLNTDYDMPITVKILSGDSQQMVTLDSLELKKISLS